MENNTTNTTPENNANSKPSKTVYLLLSILEALLAFRLIFKLLGANPGSTFVSLIYTISGVFLSPFVGIFRSATNQGIETASVLEPTTIIAMMVYALIAYGIVKLIDIYKTSKDKDVR